MKTQVAMDSDHPSMRLLSPQEAVEIFLGGSNNALSQPTARPWSKLTLPPPISTLHGYQVSWCMGGALR
jgi:hypothetical protein